MQPKFAFYITSISILSFTLVLGFCVEIVQSKFGRSVDSGDLYRNLLGCLLALVFLTYRQKSNRIWKIAIGAFICALIVIEQTSLFKILALRYQQYQSLPILAGFSNKNEKFLWSKGKVVESTLKDGTNALRVELNAGNKYSGVAFKEVHRDWSGYSDIQFTIVYDSTISEKLCIKITDLEHDNNKHDYSNRFNHCITLYSGKNVSAISLSKIINAPVSRQLNIKNISEVGLFMVNLKEDKVLYVEEIRLK